MKSNDWITCTNAYLQSLKAAGRSHGTIYLHRRYLFRLREIAPCPALVTQERLELWLANKEWKAETRRSAQAVARGFFTYLESCEVLVKNPAKRLAPIHVPDGIPRPATEKQVKDALQGSDNRTALMVRFAAFCGLRACEIATISGRDWDGEVLRVTGKGKRVRIIPLQDSSLIHALENCESWLFPGRIDGHLSAKWVQKLLSRSMPAGVTGHMLRHRFGTVAYRATHDLLAVGAVMGHVKTDTTKRYIKLDLDPLTRAVQAAQI